MKKGRLFILLLQLLVFGTSAFAQVPTPSDFDQLKAQIEALKQQQALSQQMIAALEKKIDAIEKASPVPAPKPPTTLPETTTTAAQRPPIAAPASDRAPAAQTRELFSQDRTAAPRIDNVPLDPDMQGFFRVGDSPTLMRFGGYAKLDVIHDFKIPGDPDVFITSAFPLGPVPAANSTNVQARQSRFNSEIRRPTPLGELRVFYENDFFGAGPTVFHLRHLYGQVHNVLVGWTYSTFMDVDSLPDTLDFEGPGSMVYVTQPQFRYTLPVTKANSIAFSVEKPTTDINITNPNHPSVVATPTTPIPDFVIRYRYEASKGHVQLGTVLRSVGGFAPAETSSGFVSDHAFGWGVNLSGALETWKQDSLLFQAAFGRGIGRYIEDLTGLGPDAALNSSLQLRATPAFGTFVAYQHYWHEKWRSTATYGYAHVQGEFGQSETFFRKSNYAAFNLIWNPTGNFNVGAEYLYGNLTAKDANRGFGSRLQFSLQYDFFRWGKDSQ